MKVRMKYEDGKVITFEKGKSKVVEREINGIAWSTRTGKVRFADGSVHDAILEFCDNDSGEHYGTAIWTEDGDLAWQDDVDFLEVIKKDAAEVYPYKYKYSGYMHGDHHIGVDGWSN